METKALIIPTSEGRNLGGLEMRGKRKRTSKARDASLSEKRMRGLRPEEKRENMMLSGGGEEDSGIMGYNGSLRWKLFQGSQEKRNQNAMF